MKPVSTRTLKISYEFFQYTHIITLICHLQKKYCDSKLEISKQRTKKIIGVREIRRRSGKACQ